jgi:hypothetical protein
VYRIWILVGQIQFFGIVFPGIVSRNRYFLDLPPPPKEEILADGIWGIKIKKVCMGHRHGQGHMDVDVDIGRWARTGTGTGTCVGRKYWRLVVGGPGGMV